MTLLLLASPLVVLEMGVRAPVPPAPGDSVGTLAGEDFTHSVFAEDMTATWCVHCPPADEHLGDIYYHDGYDRRFFWVAMITDMNDKADARTDDYPTFSGYPTVYFDGGYREVVGNQSGEDGRQNYVDAIEESGVRDDRDLSLHTSMVYLGNDTIAVRVWITWNEDGTIANPTYDGHLRAYIVEPVSRYNNHRGRPYNFGFLDYAFDQDVELEPRTETRFSTLWNGSDYQDTQGNNFSDLEYDNLNVFVAVFNSHIDDGNEYAVQAAGAMPPTLSLEAPSGPVKGLLELAGQGWGNRSQLAEAQYRLDGGEWLAPRDSTLDPAGGNFSLEVDLSDLPDGNHTLDVRLVDEYGTDNWKRLELEVATPPSPPQIGWHAPSLAQPLQDTVTLEVEVTDDQSLELVELSLDGGPYQEMQAAGGDRYTFEWNTATASDGPHDLTVRAVDSQGTEANRTWQVSVDNGGEPTLPALTLLAPAAGSGPLSGSVELRVRATDPEGVQRVFYTFTGTAKEHLLTEAGNDEYTATWNTLKAASGPVTLNVTAEDQEGTLNWVTGSYPVDNERPSLQVSLPDLMEGQAWGRQLLRIQAEDHQGTVEVTYSVDDGPLLPVSLSAPGLFEHQWNTLNLEDGDHTLLVRATDEAGNQVQWTTRVEVVNQALAFSYASRTVVSSSRELELIIPLPQELPLVSVVFTLPEGLPPLTAPWDGAGYAVPLPTDFDTDTEVHYHLVLDTGHGKIYGPDQTYSVEFQGRGGGGSNDQDDGVAVWMVAISVGAVAVVALAGYLAHHHQRDEPGDDWDLGPAGPAAQGPPAPPTGAPATPAPELVACPYCQIHLEPPPGPRPMVLACSNCSGQFQVL